MPKIVQIMQDNTVARGYLGVDSDGRLWKGEVKTSQPRGDRYIDWTPLHQEFPKGV